MSAHKHLDRLGNADDPLTPHVLAAVKARVPINDIAKTFGLTSDSLRRLIASKAPSITRDAVTNLLLQAVEETNHPKDIIAAARELGKLHGLYEQTDSPTINIEAARARISQLSTRELEQLISDAEYTEIPSEPQP